MLRPRPAAAAAVVRRMLSRVVVAGAVAAAGLGLTPVGAQAATTLTVSSTADVSASAGACGNPGIITPPVPLSLREATCLANNVGGAVTITVPAGTYLLTDGELTPGLFTGQSVTITGAGAASTVINAQGLSRVFDIDPNGVGGITTALSGLTVFGGLDNTFGGGGIIAGSGNGATADVMTLDSMVINANRANASTQGRTDAPGGGMQFIGGRLTVTNSTFSSNLSYSSAGSGLFYGGTGATASEGLTVTNTLFNNNTATNSSTVPTVPNGGALAVQGLSTSYAVTNSRFVNNSVSATTAPAVGAAILVQSGTLSVSGSTFTGNTVSGGPSNSGGAIYEVASAVTLRHNRFVGNVSNAGGAVARTSGSVDAALNWWGCNGGPGAAGCDSVAGAVTVTPRLVLTASASPATVMGPNATSTVTAGLTTDSLGGAVSPANLGAFTALPVTFSDPPGTATVGGSSGAKSRPIASGQTTIDYQSNTASGPSPVTATFDNASVAATVTVNAAPAITSPSAATFAIGAAGSFTVTTTGFPIPVLAETGALPPGVTFTDNGDGTATLSGTPTGGGGTFPLTITANNGTNPNATQSLTVSVGQAPLVTSPATASFTRGVAGSFTVTTSGVPTVTSITRTGTLPTGLTFTDNGNGTATISGTPTSNGGSYPLTLTATNGVAPNGTQTLTLQVAQAPQVVLNPADQTVAPGTSVTFSAAANGVPTPTVQWQRSTNGGASFTNIAGATSTTYTFVAAVGDDGNQYRAVFTNTTSSATTTAATLRVGTAPTFTSASSATLIAGSPGVFTVTTTGIPSAAITATTLPTWLSFTDNEDGTAALTGNPPPGSGGTYGIDLAAANGFAPSATQTLTLTVEEAPSITSAASTTFRVGAAGSFTVTTTAGFPTTTTLTESGALPAGVTFTDNGDGTATLGGTPAGDSGGSYPVTFSASAVGGGAAPGTQSFTLTVLEPAAITSADHITFTAGTAGTFTVTTTGGFPTAIAIAATGTLPGGVTLVDNGDGTATLAGTPTAGSGDTYALTLSATNSPGVSSAQSFTLTVNEAASITSAASTAFTVGAAGSFTVTTTAGFPTTTTLAESGALPAGVTFTDNGDGTATLGGTPAGDSGGSYPVTFSATAAGGGTPSTTQSFTLTVLEASDVTSADHATFTVGTAGSFTVTTAGGHPLPPQLAESGPLPAGVTFVDNGDGTATLAGTPTAGAGGTYALTLSATNASGVSSTQSFTLTVNEAPSITSAASTSFRVGAAGSFTVTTTAGFPTTTTLAESGALPAGVTFTDNGDGTATLAGNPAAGEGGTYSLTFSATAAGGGTPSTTQPFTLTVLEASDVTSLDHTTLTVGAAGSFTVTTTNGYPLVPQLAESGPLPAGVTFVDNGDGTATLAGTPTAGAGGTYALTVSATNSPGVSSTQSFTLTVNEAPSITSSDRATLTVGLPGSFTVTTSPGVPTSSVLTETGALPPSVAFTDNGDGTATIAGAVPLSGAGTYTLRLTASNGVDPDAVQAFTLTVAPAGAVPLPPSAPSSDGILHGVPPTTTVGQVLHVSGDGFLPGATVTLGLYSTPTALGTATADPVGRFTADITVPDLTGSHVAVAIGTGADGATRSLTASTTISRVGPTPTPTPTASSTPTTTPTTGGGGATADDPDLPSTGAALAGPLAGGLALLLGGVVLVGSTRRRRSATRT